VKRWIWVSLPWATFAIAVQNGRIVDGPPYAWAVVRKLGNDERKLAAHWQGPRTEFRDLGEVP
jgi:hypothetical protein